MAAIPLCRSIHIGGKDAIDPPKIMYDVGLTAFPSMTEQASEALILDYKILQRLGMRLIDSVLRRIECVDMASAVHTIQARASEAKKQARLMAELKKCRQEHDNWKGPFQKEGGRAQARAGRNALMRNFLLTAEVHQLRRCAPLAALAAWQSNMKLHKAREARDRYRRSGWAQLGRCRLAYSRSLAQDRIGRWASRALSRNVRMFKDHIIMTRLKEGSAILLFVKKRWQRRDEVRAVSNWRSALLKKHAEQMADTIFANRIQGIRAEQARALASGDLARAAILAAEMAAEEETSDAKTLAEMMEEDQNRRIAQLEALIAISQDEEQKRRASQELEELRMLSVREAKNRARERAAHAEQEAEEMAKRVEELQKQLAAVEAAKNDPKASQEKEIAEQLAAVAKKAEDRMMRMIAQADADVEEAKAEARRMETRVQHALDSARMALENAQSTSEETTKAVEAAKRAMESATDETSREAARREMEVAQKAEQLVQEALEKATSDVQRLQEEAEDAGRRAEQQINDARTEALVKKEQLDQEARVIRAQAHEETTKRVMEKHRCAAEAEKVLCRELEKSRMELELEKARVLEQSIIAEGGTAQQMQAAHEDRVARAMKVHEAQLALAKEELKVLSNQKDITQSQLNLVVSSRQSSSLRRASSILRKCHSRSTSLALKTWQINYVKAKEREHFEERLAKSKELEEPKDGADIFMAERLKEVEAAKKKLEQAQAAAKQAEQKAKRELRATIEQSEARQIALRHSMEESEASQARQRARLEAASAAAEKAAAAVAEAAERAEAEARKKLEEKVAALQAELDIERRDGDTSLRGHEQKQRVEELTADLLSARRSMEEDIKAAKAVAEAEAMGTAEAARVAQAREEAEFNAVVDAANSKQAQLAEALRAEEDMRQAAREEAKRAEEAALESLAKSQREAEEAKQRAEAEQSSQDKELAAAWAEAQQAKQQALERDIEAAMAKEKAKQADFELQRTKLELQEAAQYGDVEAERSLRIALKKAEDEGSAVREKLVQLEAAAEQAIKERDLAAQVAHDLARQALEALPSSQKQAFEEAAVQDQKRYEEEVAKKAPVVRVANRKATLRRCRKIMNTWLFHDVEERLQLWLKNMYVRKETERASNVVAGNLAVMNDLAQLSKEDQLEKLQKIVIERDRLQTEMAKASLIAQRNKVHLVLLLSRLLLLHAQRRIWESASKWRNNMLGLISTELGTLRAEIRDKEQLAKLRAMCHMVSMVIARWKSIDCSHAVSEWRTKMLAMLAEQEHQKQYLSMQRSHAAKISKLEAARDEALSDAKEYLAAMNNSGDGKEETMAATAHKKTSEKLAKLQQELLMTKRTHSLQQLDWILRRVKLAAFASVFQRLKDGRASQNVINREQERHLSLLQQSKVASGAFDALGSDSKDFHKIQELQKKTQRLTLKLILTHRLCMHWKQIVQRTVMRCLMSQAKAANEVNRDLELLRQQIRAQEAKLDPGSRDTADDQCEALPSGPAAWPPSQQPAGGMVDSAVVDALKVEIGKLKNEAKESQAAMSKLETSLCQLKKASTDDALRVETAEKAAQEALEAYEKAKAALQEKVAELVIATATAENATAALEKVEGGVDLTEMIAAAAKANAEAGLAKQRAEEASKVHALIVSDHIISRLQMACRMQSSALEGQFWMWRAHAVKLGSERKIQREVAQKSSELDRHGGEEAATMAKLREETAKKLKAQDDQSKRDIEQLQKERQKALAEAEAALTSLAALEGDEREVAKLLKKQAEASQRLSEYKEQLRRQHTLRLLTAMKTVFKHFEDAHLLRLIHIWHSHFSTWREKEQRRREVEQQVKIAVTQVQRQLDTVTKQLSEQRQIADQLSKDSKRAVKASVFSLYTALGRHALTAKRAAMEMWCGAVGERRGVKHLNMMLADLLAELVQAQTEREEVILALNEARGKAISLQRELDQERNQGENLAEQFQHGTKAQYKKVELLETEMEKLKAALERAQADAKKKGKEVTMLRATMSMLQSSIAALKMEMEERKDDAAKVADMFNAAAMALVDERGNHSQVNQALLSVHWVVCKVYTLLFNAMKKSRLTAMENPLSSDWRMEEESSLLRKMQVRAAADVVQWDHKMLEKAYHWLRLKLVEQEVVLDPLRGHSIHIPGSLPFSHARSSPGLAVNSHGPTAHGDTSVMSIHGTGGSVVDALNLLRTTIDKPPDGGSPMDHASDDLESRGEFFVMLRRRLEELLTKVKVRWEKDPSLKTVRETPLVQTAPLKAGQLHSGLRPSTSDSASRPGRGLLFDPLAPTSKIWTHHQGGRVPDNNVLELTPSKLPLRAGSRTPTSGKEQLTGWFTGTHASPNTPGMVSGGVEGSAVTKPTLFQFQEEHAASPPGPVAQHSRAQQPVRMIRVPGAPRPSTVGGGSRQPVLPMVSGQGRRPPS